MKDPVKKKLEKSALRYFGGVTLETYGAVMILSVAIFFLDCLSRLTFPDLTGSLFAIGWGLLGVILVCCSRRQRCEVG